MEPTGLAEYLIKLRDNWLNSRKKRREPGWNTNYALVNNQDPPSGEPWKAGEGSDWRSNTFIPLPKAKLMSAFSMIIEVLLAGGVLPFTLKPAKEPDDPDKAQATEEAIDRMVDLMREQHADRRVDRRYLKHIMSALLYGETVSKYNIDTVTRVGFKSVVPEGEIDLLGDIEQSWEYYEEEQDVPGHDYVSVWNFLYDPEDENLKTNRGQIELLEMSRYELRRKKGLPLYNDEAIDRAISEHSEEKKQDTDSMRPALRDLENRKRTLDAFEAWCRVPRRLVTDFLEKPENRELSGIEPDETGDDVEILAEVVNKEIVRFTEVEPKDRPYRRMKWEDMLDLQDGLGIPDNLVGISRALNGMQRAFEDNKKLSANVIVALKRSMLAKPGQADEMKPGLQIDIAESVDDVRQALFPIVIPDVGETLISGIGMMERWGDTASMIPQILQGITLPKQKSDTAFEINQLLEQAGKYLGRGIRNFDEGMIEPETWDMYLYNMQDPEVPADHKADAKVHPGGFMGFQNRIIRGQKVRELLAMIVTSELLVGEVKITPHLKVIYQSEYLDPDEFLLSQEEKEQNMQQRAQMEAEARAQAMKDLQDQERIRLNSALAEIDAKGQVDKEKETHKAGLESQMEEEDFQREIIKGA